MIWRHNLFLSNFKFYLTKCLTRILKFQELCENTLNASIDEDSVLCLLGIADRFRATVLKSNCLSFISQHSSLTKAEMFRELPRAIQVIHIFWYKWAISYLNTKKNSNQYPLQLEVQDLIHWFGRVAEPWSDGFKSRSSSRHSLKSPSKQRSRSRKSSPSLMWRWLETVKRQSLLQLEFIHVKRITTIWSRICYR